MTKKSDLSWRIGMFMLVLCAALVLTVLPAAANYSAEGNLTEYDKGVVSGGLEYTIGNSYYSPKMWNNYMDTGVPNYYEAVLNPELPDTATNHSARLYVYWTWSFCNDEANSSKYNSGVVANMSVKFDDTTFLGINDVDGLYWDTKNASDLSNDPQLEKYNFLSGTYAYDVTDYVDATDEERVYSVNISNCEPIQGWIGNVNNSFSFNVQAVGLVITYNDSDHPSLLNHYYWIDEGCDMTCVKWNTSTTPNSWDYGITPDDAVSRARFTDVDLEAIDVEDITSAELITCVPSGNTYANRLYFNGFSNYSPWNTAYWNGLWHGTRDPNFSMNSKDVKDYLIDGDNYVGFQNGLYSNLPSSSEGQMQAANAFLVINNDG